MFYFCAICMVKRSLVELNSERRRFLEVIVSPFLNLAALKSCRVLICLNCNRLLSTMLRFQQTVLKGLLNLIALQKRTKYVCHDLPDVINGQSDLLLPVANEEVVISSGFYFVHKKRRPSKDLKPTDSLYCDEKILYVPDEIEETSNGGWKKTKKIVTSINKNGQPKLPGPRPEVSTSTMSYESDLENPDTEPGYKQVVSTSKMYDHGYTDTYDMAVLVPINNTDKKESVNTNESNEVKKTKLNRQLYKAIKLALKSHSISEDFDISQYEPESESATESPYELDSENSESTLTCLSDYEDAESFPNVVFAKAFNDVSDDVDADVKKKLHVVTNPPSEWPCTFEPCHLKHGMCDGDDNFSDDFDEDPVVGHRRKAKLTGRRNREECTICKKTFVNLYSLWVHYEKYHVDVCRKECCNGAKMRKNYNEQSKVKEQAEPRFNCAECGVSFRSNEQMNVHLATLRHRVRMQLRFQCDSCKRKFKDKIQMANHIEREHLEKGALKCPMCPSTFRSTRTLHKHAAAHILAHEAQANDDNTQDGRKIRRRTRGSNARKRTQNGRKRTGDGNASETVTNSGNKRRRMQDCPNVRKRMRDVVMSWEAMQDTGNTRRLAQDGHERSQDMSNAWETIRDRGNTRRLTQDGHERTHDTSNAWESIQDMGNTHRTQKAPKPRWRPKTSRAARKQTKKARKANTKKENIVQPRLAVRNDLFDSWLQIAGLPTPMMPS